MIVDVHNHMDTDTRIKGLLKGEKEVTILENGVPAGTYRPIHYQFDERVEGMDRAGVGTSFR